MFNRQAVTCRISKHLSAKAILAGALITIVTSGLLLTVQFTRAIAINANFLERDTQNIAESYQAELAKALITNDSTEVEPIIRSIIAAPFILSVGLYHNDDKALFVETKKDPYSRGEFKGIAKLLKQPIRSSTLLIHSTDDISRQLGYLNIDFDIRFHIERVASTIVQNMLFLVAQGIVISLLLIVFYYRYLCKPIVEIAKQIKQCDIPNAQGGQIGGKYQPRNDELGALVNELNTFIQLVDQAVVAKETALNAADHSYKNLSTLLESLPHFISVKDLSGRLLLANKSYVKALQLDPDNYIGVSENDFLSFVPESTRKTLKYADEEVLAQEKTVVLPEVEWKFSDGKFMALEMRKIVISYRGHKAILTVALDITERKEHQARVQYLAYHDSLTNLPNRHLFLDRLDQALLRAHRSGLYGALIFFDLDNFKNHNDTRGHLFGDEILINIAKRLKDTIRNQDTIARLGGDEFVICLTELSDDELTAKNLGSELVERILTCLRQPLTIENTSVQISASLGVAYFNNDSLSASELLQHADLAMYKAKEAGRNRVFVFENAMAETVARLRQLKIDSKEALADKQFYLVFQPQFDSETMEITGAEALLRWKHPTRGIVSPDEFIPLLEESGLMPLVGQWVIQNAVKTASIWHDHKLVKKGFKISINVSPQQFRQVSFAHEVQRIVNQYSLEAELINLEITESMIIDDITHTANAMNELRNIGINFSIDDFGTGYSNLNYLKLLPLDIIKIDQSFVRDILKDQSSIAIVQTILSMAKQLNLTTIAEGVETQHQLEALKKMGCHVYQGYLYSPPIKAEQFQQLLEN
jgi:diguanylate cyclase (GGDEF)-like protein/PAS domain S-box-containing protein